MIKKSIGSCSLGGILELPEDAVFLHLSPFVKDGLWGGAIRSHAIMDTIKKHYPSSYTIYCWKIMLKEQPMPSYFAGHNDVLSDVKMLFIDFKVELYLEKAPDVVIFDHPWLWNEAKKIKKMFPNCKIIHSSQNIEWQLKKDLLAHIDKDVAKKVVSFVEKTEKEIAQQSDLVLCCTENDKKWFIENGSKNVIVAGNGTYVKKSNVESSKKYILVVGSGHPPNVKGSLEYLSDATEWMPEDTDLIFVGEMCNGLRGAMGIERNDDKNTTIRFLGKRPNEDLEKLIQSASVIALPIPYGGGSNLKTSEALVSGRPIVGTSISFRGFNDFKDSENVIVADDVNEFRKALNGFCEKKEKTIIRKNIKQLTWDGCLEEFENFITSS